tara:strand:+ start:423 stop:641 length:219 start_codon:yes stop_codon:yes gene_type:complete
MKVLDLHGYRHHEVPRILHAFINSNLGKELKIIFGNSPRMRDIVLETVEPYRFRITRSDIYLNRKYIIILTI